MSKRSAQKSIIELFAAKKKLNDDEIEGNKSASTSNSEPKQSKPNHNIHFTLRMEPIECANGNHMLFDFDLVFPLSGTSTNQSNIGNENSGCGELGLDSTARIHIEGTAHENVEIQVKVGDDCKFELK